ncbi:hypothetical protein GH741_12150 [Aquibacillus halophilus]|uniref:Uncharacterized protein n=1 Tax=Aquibacillus halophilus TaxID=930132 RepID=A0A6A8DDW3_9BACI|nr:hypothetical protein [Aquibacillus halophilus]MRH43430.1 hypothetical protein [Aquibacillus halophilus]
MKKMFDVYLGLENGRFEGIILTSDSSNNLEEYITKNVWIRCEQTGKYFNMNKIVSFEVQERVK